MITAEHRKRNDRWHPFRSTGQRILTCIRCEHYRRQAGSVPAVKLARFGLRGCCIRPEGLCQGVRV